MPRRNFTAEEDAYLIANYGSMQLLEIAKQFGRCWTSVQQRRDRLARRGLLDKANRAYNPSWTEESEQYLSDHWGLLPDASVAQHLHRSIVACSLKASRMHINRKMNVWTAREVGEIFGVHGKTVVHWHERGWLTAKRSSLLCGANVCWNFAADDLERFVCDMPWAYDRALMVEGDYLTLLAKRVAKADPWLGSEQAAKVAGINVGTLRRWCASEGLPCQHRPKLGTHWGPHQGLLMIRKADLLTWLEKHTAEAHANRSASAKLRMSHRHKCGETQ